MVSILKLGRVDLVHACKAKVVANVLTSMRDVNDLNTTKASGGLANTHG